MKTAFLRILDYFCVNSVTTSVRGKDRLLAEKEIEAFIDPNSLYL